jgi:hypothetical protein
MLRRARSRRRRQILAAATMLLAAAIVAVPLQQAVALILGGEGNHPIADPGWPKGAAAIFNGPARIAWWEGPAFGGGQWHAECRGDAKALSNALADFATLDVRAKRVFVLDGVGSSSWLKSGVDPAKKVDTRIDWVFMVWQPAKWERLRKLPADLDPTDPADAEQGPLSSIAVYTGGPLRWSDVTVPKGLEVVDRRLQAHGFTPADGIVLEGKVVDLATKQPLAARVRLQRIEPRMKGGYDDTVMGEAVADVQGRWVLKKMPPGWHRLVIEADGFVPRVVSHARFDDQPRWQSYDCGLSRPAPVSGRIIDQASRPLADVEVRFRDVVSDAGGRYESPRESTVRTGADGRFRADQLPVGRATIWPSKPGYCRPGSGQPITLPSQDVELRMIEAARLRVTGDFTGIPRPRVFFVRLEPEGGESAGRRSADKDINVRDQVAFDDWPPGRYLIRGSDGYRWTPPIPIILNGGRMIEVTLAAKGLVPAPPGPIRVGQAAPSVVAFTSGGDFDIQRYYQDRYVLLTFWSLHDEAGRRQFEELRRIRRAMAEEDRLLILSVCTDNGEGDYEAWFRFLDSQGKVDYGDRDRRGPFPFYCDPKWVNTFQDDSHFVSSAAYGVERLPGAFLIGPDRRLRAVRIPVDTLGGVVAEALKTAP